MSSCFTYCTVVLTHTFGTRRIYFQKLLFIGLLVNLKLASFRTILLPLRVEYISSKIFFPPEMCFGRWDTSKCDVNRNLKSLHVLLLGKFHHHWFPKGTEPDAERLPPLIIQLRPPHLHEALLDHSPPLTRIAQQLRKSWAHKSLFPATKFWGPTCYAAKTSWGT